MIRPSDENFKKVRSNLEKIKIIIGDSKHLLANQKKDEIYKLNYCIKYLEDLQKAYKKASTQQSLF
jgi:hypothetical protein